MHVYPITHKSRGRQPPSAATSSARSKRPMFYMFGYSKRCNECDI